MKTNPTVTASEKTQWLTYKDVIVELNVSRSTLNKWRADGKSPSFIVLPNGELRIRRRDLEAWLNQLQKVA
jgi:excisionase family DNA binding protein